MLSNPSVTRHTRTVVLCRPPALASTTSSRPSAIVLKRPKTSDSLLSSSETGRRNLGANQRLGKEIVAQHVSDQRALPRACRRPSKTAWREIRCEPGPKRTRACKFAAGASAPSPGKPWRHGNACTGHASFSPCVIIAVSFSSAAGIAGGWSCGGSGSVTAGAGNWPITRSANPAPEVVIKATTKTIERNGIPSRQILSAGRSVDGCWRRSFKVVLRAEVSPLSDREKASCGTAGAVTIIASRGYPRLPLEAAAERSRPRSHQGKGTLCHPTASSPPPSFQD